MRNQRGITLVALVITIIVLLILAGVSIAMLTGDNGILTKATQAKSQSSAAETKEALGMVMNEIRAELYSPSNNLTYNLTKDASGNISSDTILSLFNLRYGSNMKLVFNSTTAPTYTCTVYYGISKDATPTSSTVSYNFSIDAGTFSVTQQ